MSRRGGNLTRRFTGSGGVPLGGIFHSKSPTSSLLSIVLVLLGTFLFIAYFYRGSGSSKFNNEVSKIEGDFGCTFDVQKAIPVLMRTYGDSMNRVLHVGPDTCSVVSRLKKEAGTEAWGVEPYDIEDADLSCRRLVHKGLVRVADIKFPLPYRAKSFSLVIVSDAVDYLSPKYLNKTLPDLARLSAENLVIFTGYPVHSRAKFQQQQPKFGRPVSSYPSPKTLFAFKKSYGYVKYRISNPSSKRRETDTQFKAKMRSTTWWARFFVQTSLEENEAAAMKFEQAASEISYRPRCQVFHLNSYH